MDIDIVADPVVDYHQYDQQPLDIRVGGSIALKTGQIISYLDRDTGVSHTAKVMGRAGKATGNIRTGSIYNTQNPLTLQVP